MPFTLSHAAATLPIKWHLGPRADLAALAIGSMAPDFPYFLRLPLPWRATHSLFGILWFCLPMGLLAWLLWRHVLRSPIRMLAPASVGCRIPLVPPSAPSLPVLAGSVLMGALTHVLWDAFTHGNGAGTQELPILGRTVTTLLSFDLQAYHFLQHGSTLLGGLALLIAIRRWTRTTPAVVASDGVKKGHWNAGRIAMLTLPPLFGLAYSLSTTPLVAELFYIRLFVGRGVVSAMSAGFLVLILFGILERAGSFRSSPTTRARGASNH